MLRYEHLQEAVGQRVGIEIVVSVEAHLSTKIVVMMVKVMCLSTRYAAQEINNIHIAIRRMPSSGAQLKSLNINISNINNSKLTISAKEQTHK